MDLLTLVGPLMTAPAIYPLLAGLTALDGLLPMIPSEAVLLGAGAFAHTTGAGLVPVVLAAAAGVFVGDHLAYGLSRSVFGPRLIARSRHLGRAVDAAARHLDRRGSLLIMASRFLPGGRVTMNAACGTTRLPLSRFSPASAVAALAWAAYTAGLGFLGGAAFVANPLLGLALGLGLSFALGGVIELVRRRAARRHPAPVWPVAATAVGENASAPPGTVPIRMLNHPPRSVMTTLNACWRSLCPPCSSQTTTLITASCWASRCAASGTRSSRRPTPARHGG